MSSVLSFAQAWWILHDLPRFGLHLRLLDHQSFDSISWFAFRSLCTYSIFVAIVEPCLRIDVIKVMKLKIILFIRESSSLFVLGQSFSLYSSCRFVEPCRRDLVQLWKSQIYFVSAFGELCGNSFFVQWIWELILATTELRIIVCGEVYTEFAHKYSLLWVEQS